MSMQLTQNISTKWTPLFLLYTLVALTLWTCKYPEGPLNPNTIPDTRMANVPSNDDTAKYIGRNAFPEIQMQWVGNDQDGYVIAFQYRWVSTGPRQPFPAPGQWSTVLNLTNPNWDNMIQVKGNPSSMFNLYNFLATLGQNDTSLIRIIGDSLFSERTFAVPYKTGVLPTDSIAGSPLLSLQQPTIGTFIFNSPLDSNKHMFEVRSVDNSDDVDPSPAFVNFWTLKSPESICIIDSVPPANAFAIREITDTFLGLRFAFSPLDGNNSESYQYSWSVDDTISWTPWSNDQRAFVTASHFKPIQSGAHVFYVRARNRWGVVSANATSVFTATVPRIDSPGWPKRTLVINNMDYRGNGTPGRPTLGQVDTLYSEIMDSIGLSGRFDIWRVRRPNNTFAWPARDTLGYYTSVVILSERFIEAVGGVSGSRMTGGPQAALRDYLNIGGKLIYSGSPGMTTTIATYNSLNAVAGTWAIDVFHTIPVTAQSPYITSQGLDFNGVKGVLGYPSVALDPSKIAPDSIGASTNIRNIGLNFPQGFAETISLFDSKVDGTLEDKPVGIRFLAPPPSPPARQTYSVVFFGFPLYYGERPSMIQSMRKAIQDINE